MVKSASPWLRSLLRAGKRQQRAVTRAVKGLLASTPAATPKVKRTVKRTPKAKPAAVSKPVAALRAARAPAPARTRAKAPTAVGAVANGKWLSAIYAALAEHGVIRRLRYWLYVPDAATAPACPAGMPLIVMLHGCDQSATQFAEGTRMNQLAGRLGYAVCYPQQSLTNHPHRCWKWYDRATQQGGGDVGLIVGVVEQIIARYPIDRSRIYICGMSAGAGMAHVVALNHPTLFAALGLHSGPMFGAGHSQMGALGVMQHGAEARVDTAIAEVMARHRGAFPALPTVLIQGEADHVVRPVNQVQLARQALHVNRLSADSIDAAIHKPGTQRSRAYLLRDAYRQRKLVMRVARIAGLDHAWSGGDARLSFNAAAGPDASRMLLDFFKRQRRTAPAAR